MVTRWATHSSSDQSRAWNLKLRKYLLKDYGAIHEICTCENIPLYGIYPKQLRLASARVSTQQNVDLGTKSAMTSVLEVLPGAPKQLQQNALLDVLIFIDAGSWQRDAHICTCINLTYTHIHTYTHTHLVMQELISTNKCRYMYMYNYTCIYYRFHYNLHSTHSLTHPVLGLICCRCQEPLRAVSGAQFGEHWMSVWVWARETT